MLASVTKRELMSAARSTFDFAGTSTVKVRTWSVLRVTFASVATHMPVPPISE